ncbi:MAG: alpha/beta fold hydrolase [Prosthecobacter sp.]|uniref:alpha/beta fold hydrolase n=1 Tax=Prosthecobacter sp. TaxID=1965333 RepID=UPI0038FD7398
MKRLAFLLTLTFTSLTLAQNAALPDGLKKIDRNGDGKVTREEMPKLFDQIDADKDGVASVAELTAYFAKAKSSAPAPSSANPNEPAARGALPEGVEKRAITIWSDGTRMAGDLYLPKNRKEGEKLPAIVFCAGTGGTKGGTGGRLGPIFAEKGYVALAFDYRGWGESESQLMAVDPQPKPDEKGELTLKVKALRWQMNYTDQTEDIRAAISFLAGEPSVDPQRIGIMGSSYGGGLVTYMAGTDPRVKCVVAQVPGLGGARTAAQTAAFRLHTQQARGEIEPVPLETGKMTGKMEKYSNMRTNAAKSIGFSALEAAAKIAVPALFVVAENEELSNNDTVAEVQRQIAARGVPSKYHVIKGITHYGIYREGFQEASTLEIAWFEEHLKGAAAKPAASAPETPPAPKTAPSTKAAPNLEEGFKALDSDKSGKLSGEEFAALKQSTPYFREHPDHLEPAFKKLDADTDGALTLEEYRNIAKPRQSKGGQGKGKAKRPPAETEAPKTSTEATADKSTRFAAADLDFFEKNIRPVLIKSCYECHSAEAEKLKADFALDTRDALLKGGDSGAAVVLGKPEESLLIASLRHDDPDLKMPPEKHGGKLSDSVIADFTEWVKRGVPMPAAQSVTTNEKMEARLAHWSFQPVKDAPAPAVKNTSWPRTEVDRFVLAELEAKGLAPVGDAEPAALLRRVHLDLTGLPPTAEQVQAFLANASESRIEGVIDELMKSPQFGERWGRHWLDVARYAESSGKETDFAYPQAWRYRDYVIKAFNQDMPFDQFIREQIAGDLFEVRDDKERAELLIATGFLAIGPKSHIEKNPLQFEMDLVDEQIDAVSQAFLATTMACARCHDHKYDPVSQRDYYALAGIFRSTDTKFGTIKLVQNNNVSPLVPLPATAGQPNGLKPLASRERDRLEKNVARDSARLAELTKEKMFASSEFVRTRIRLATDKAHLDAYEADGTPKQFVTCVLEREKPRDSALLIRGEVQKPGEMVQRGLPMLAKTSAAIPSGSGRKELASWISSPDNPLTARVIVNRVWLHLFGQGIVTTPDNFGLSGQAPSHPALLDHLAARFVKEGWSVKKLVLELMTSRVYALSTAHDAKNFEADPDNTLLWRMTPRRLDAESIRDAMLLTAGKLDLTPPTGSAVAMYGEGYVTGVQTVVRGALDQISPHRSVYLPVMRNLPLESLALFDMTPGSIVTGQRPQTTVPAQSLYLMNSPYVLKAAEFAAQRLLTDRPKSEPHRVKLAYERIFNRPPTDSEVEAALKFVKTKPDAAQGWAALCQSLWASHEFLARS